MDKAIVHFHDNNGKLLGTAVAVNDNGVARIGFSTVHKNDAGNRKRGTHIATQRANSGQAITAKMNHQKGEHLAMRIAIGSVLRKVEVTNREDNPNNRAVEVLSRRDISDSAFRKVVKL